MTSVGSFINIVIGVINNEHDQNMRRYMWDCDHKDIFEHGLIWDHMSIIMIIEYHIAREGCARVILRTWPNIIMIITMINFKILMYLDHSESQ